MFHSSSCRGHDYNCSVHNQATNGNKKVTSLALCARSNARSHVTEKQVADKLTEAKQHKENAEEPELEVVISNEEEAKRNEAAHADWEFTADEVLNARRGSLGVLVNDRTGEGDHRYVDEWMKDRVFKLNRVLNDTGAF